MSARLPIAIVVFIIAFVSTALAAPVLRSRPVVDGETITLADILTETGDAGAVVVAAAPRPGRRAMISISRLRAIARANGVPWKPRVGTGRITVRRASVAVTEVEVADRIAQTLANDEPGSRYRVELGTRSLRVDLPIDSPTTIDILTLDLDRRRGRFRARIAIAAGTPYAIQATVVGRATAMVDIPVLRHRLARDAVIGADDIEWIDYRRDRLPSAVITAAEDLVGRGQRRGLRPGRPIRASDLRAPLLVDKGSQVLMTYRTSFMVLSVVGRALDEGGAGETVRVLNLTSNRVVEATVAGSSRVTVLAGLALD